MPDFFLFGLFTYFWIIPHFIDKPSFYMPELPSDLYPKFIVGTIILLGAILFLQGIFSPMRKDQEKMPMENKKRAAIIISVLIAFLFAIDIIGFYIAVAGFLVGMITYLGERRTWVISLSVVIFMVLSYLFFEQGLKLTLPRGIIFEFYLN